MKSFLTNDRSAKNTSDEEIADILASLSTTSRVFSPKHQREESPASVLSSQPERRHIIPRSYYTTSPRPIQTKGERIAFRSRPPADSCENMNTPTSILRRAKARHLTDPRHNVRMMILKRQHYLLGLGTSRSNGGVGRTTGDRSTAPHNQGTAPQITFDNSAIYEHQGGHNRQPHLGSTLNPIAGIPGQHATATPAVQHSMFGRPAGEHDADSVLSLHVTRNRALSSSLARTLIHQNVKRKRTINKECLQNSSSYYFRPHHQEARRSSSKNYEGCVLELTSEGLDSYEAARKNHIVKKALAVLQHPCSPPSHRHRLW